MKQALILRHVREEDVAGYRQPLEAAGYKLDRVDVSDPAFPALDLRAADLLIVMGGPMAVYEQDRYPWMPGELERLGQRLAADRPTLGVCLGAQMIAAALGAQVYPGPSPELGFHPVDVHAAGQQGALRHLVDVPILHWHRDTFTLPERTELLASSPLYAHQAFRRGANLLALQFHAEMGDDERYDQWIDKWPDVVRASGQSAGELRAEQHVHGARAVAAGRAMLTQWLETLR
ncbi:MAG TPA: glutamine amidotransferase [Sphingobium sp.]|nr:glutamine amidotransferase [Sphingobium sp.]